MTLSWINQWARREPAKVALIHNDRRFSYLELARSIEATRQRLSLSAPPLGTVAVVLGYSLLNSWVLVCASRALGLTTVAASSLARAQELGLASVSCVVCADDERALLSDAPALLGARRLIVPAPANHAAEDLDAASDLVGGGLGGHILYTSGTTGAYKKLLFNAAREEARARARAEVSGFNRETVFHALDFGLWTGIGFKSSSAVWLAGGAVVIDQTAQAHANFRRYAPTYAQTLPESLRAIVDASDPGKAPSKGMVLRVGGGFTPLSLAERAVARVADTLVIGFTATELTHVAMKSRFRTADDLIWLSPVDPGVVQIVDEDGALVAPGVEGELRFRLNETDSAAYLDDSVATARAFRDECFYSGDRAIRREDGRVRILGRVADVINIKGQKVAVGPIEQTLQQELGVDEVCLFLGLAGDGVEELVVAVRSRQPLVKEEVLRQLGLSKIFERVRVELFAEFPRTAAGTAKTRRTELRRMVFPD